jgi:hypothetical protein
MTNYRYTLEKYKGAKSRFKCPNCQNNSNTFVRYIDTENGKYINDNVGRCNRENKCGYHLTPKEYFLKNGRFLDANVGIFGLRSSKPLFKPTIPTYISKEIFIESLLPKRNHFLAYLTKLLGEKEALKLRETYRIGSSEHWEGATVFWQIDSKEMIRTGKIMLYDRNTGRRIKQPFNHISWVHSSNNLPNFELKQCLFGEHLLVGNNKPVGVVESEKTAIICSHFIPDKIWLATGGKSNFKADLFENLKNRKVTFYPDLGAFIAWQEKIKNELTSITHRYIDKTLEECATELERANGLDLADFLLINHSLINEN